MDDDNVDGVMLRKGDTDQLYSEDHTSGSAFSLVSTNCYT